MPAGGPWHLAFGLIALSLGGGAAHAVAPCAGTYLVRPPEGATETDPRTPKTSGKLELLVEGRFRYSLTRADREETAEGRWRATDDRVILSGDPLVAPAFVLAADEALAEPVLRIDLDLPNGLSRQFFTVAARLADGAIVGRAFTDAAFDLAIGAHDRAVALRIDVPTLALSSPEFALTPAAGHRLRVKFVANDLGKIAFTDTALIERDGALILGHAGGDVAFRRDGRCSAE